MTYVVCQLYPESNHVIGGNSIVNYTSRGTCFLPDCVRFWQIANLFPIKPCSEDVGVIGWSNKHSDSPVWDQKLQFVYFNFCTEVIFYGSPEKQAKNIFWGHPFTQESLYFFESTFFICENKQFPIKNKKNILKIIHILPYNFKPNHDLLTMAL